MLYYIVNMGVICKKKKAYEANFFIRVIGGNDFNKKIKGKEYNSLCLLFFVCMLSCQ